jgi:choline-sulfatase
MWWKSSMYEDSVRVPLVVAGPGFARGVRVRTPVSHWDLRATIFDAVGVPQPDGLPGEPLQELSREYRRDDRAVFAEYHGHGTRGSSFMVREGRWKFLYHARAPHQLFDLDADPHELHDLAATRPDVVERLTHRLYDEFCDPVVEQDRAERFIRAQLAALDQARAHATQ